MKNSIKRLLAVVMVAILALSLVAGCSDDQEPDASGFVFVPEVLGELDGISEIRDLVYSNGKLYFSSVVMQGADSAEPARKVFSMDIDGTNITEFATDSRGDDTQEGSAGNLYIMSFCVDRDGNIWILKAGPSVINILKYDRTGAELLLLDLSDFSANNRITGINAFIIDSHGNFYIGAWTGEGNSIFVLSNEGSLLFKLDVDYIDRLLKMADGSVAFFGHTEAGRVLIKIDYPGKTWGNSIALPQNINKVFPGNEAYDIFYCDRVDLLGFNANTGESTELLSWRDSDVVFDRITNVVPLPDERFICVSQTTGTATGMDNHSLIVLTKAPASERQEKTILTLASFYLDQSLQSAIVEFNATSEKYRIEATDYSVYNTRDDWSAGLIRLSTEIISGRIPDILGMNTLPYMQYVEKGLLEDLYPFIDNDPELDRSDLLDFMLRAYELDGGLYQISHSFYASTVVGNPSVVGEEMGWNMDEFRAVLENNPNADMPGGNTFEKRSFLQLAITLGIHEYVDWPAGEAYFDRGDFAQLLEFANTFPEDRDYNLTESELVSSGRQIMADIFLSEFWRLPIYRSLFGSDYVFKGYPTANRSGHSIGFYQGMAITTTCADKEGAWEFLRTILKDEWQLATITHGFPTNRAAFDERVRLAKIGADSEFPHTPLTQADIDKLMVLFESATTSLNWHNALMDIIMENVDDFLNGLTDAQETARILQNRASRYIAEQS